MPLMVGYTSGGEIGTSEDGGKTWTLDFTHAFRRLSGAQQAPGEVPEGGQVYRHGETFCGKVGDDTGNKESWGGGVYAWAWPCRICKKVEPYCEKCRDALNDLGEGIGLPQTDMEDVPGVEVVPKPQAELAKRPDVTVRGGIDD